MGHVINPLRESQGRISKHSLTLPDVFQKAYRWHRNDLGGRALKHFMQIRALQGRNGSVIKSCTVNYLKKIKKQGTRLYFHRQKTIKKVPFFGFPGIIHKKETKN